MRIGLDASCLPPLLAGAGRYICGLITALSNVDQSNEYFIFLKQRDLHWVNKLSSNFKLIVLPNFARPVRIAWQITRPHQLVTKYHLDVWHAPHYILPMNLKNVYSVVTFHDMIFFRFPEFYTATKRWFFQTMIQDAVARADAIVAVSKTTKDDINEIFGTLPDKLNHIYSGTNGEFQPVADRETLRRVKLKFNTGDKYILFVGAFEKRKNLTLLLQAFHCLVHNGYSNIKLVMVGQKENGFDEINHTIESLGIANRVVLPGYVAESDLPAL
ncbi:MAG: glycosyltransferase family 4 protein, partial [bacterium]